MSEQPTETLRLSNRFELRRQLGEGGFGVVYQAYDHRRRAMVALKELTRPDPRALERFKNEFRALVDIVHPNLVTLYELFAEDGRWYFTMEYVEGVDFLTYVRGGGGGRIGPSLSPRGEPSMVPLASQASASGRQRGWGGGEEAEDPETGVEDASTVDGALVGTEWRPSAGRVRAAPRAGVFDEARLRSAVGQLASGLEVLHATGRLHRDLKPTNVLVTRQGRVVLCDFGLVCAPDAGDEADRHEFVGTPAYMSPEQASQGPVASASDCYAMGVMLFEALTGRRSSESTSDRVSGHGLKERTVTPRELAPHVPADLDRLCAELLAPEPDARPSASQVKVRVGNGQGGWAPEARTEAAPRVGDRPFVGRAAELSVLRDAFRRSEQGQASLALVTGPSGIGKSALLEQFRGWVLAERPETVLLAGRCHAQESVPYKGVDAAIDSLARFLRRVPPEERELYLGPGLHRVARLFPVLLPFALGALTVGEAGAPGGAAAGEVHAEEVRQVRQRAFEALRELFVRVGTFRPILLVLDDLQWGDDDSGALLAELLRDPAAPPLCFVGAARSEGSEPSPLLRRLLGGEAASDELPPADRVGLSPLPPLESEQLAGLLLAQGSETPSRGRLVERLARVSEGNPFLLGELSRSLHTPDEGEEFGREPSVQQVVERRLGRLSEAGRRLLEATALSGVPLRTELLLDASGIGEAGPDALATLTTARLVRVHSLAQGEGLECYHDRIREAVSAAMAPEVKRACHRSLVRVLEGSEGVDPELVARHLVECGERGQALRWMVKAAERAMEALAFDRAARLYAEAVTLPPPRADQRTLLAERQADALAAAGRSAEAGRLFLQVAAQAPKREAFRLSLRAAELLLKGGHYDEALPVVREVFRELGMRFPAGRVEAYVQAARELAWLKLQGLEFRSLPAERRSDVALKLSDACWAVAEPLQAVDPVVGYVLVLRNTRHSLRSGDPFRAGRALALQCVQTSMLSPGTEAPRQAFAAAARVAEEARDPRLGPLLKLASATAAFFRGEFLGALAEGLEAESLLHSEVAGMQWESSTSALAILSALQWLGRWGELGHRLPGYLRAATDRGDLYGAAALSGAFGGFPGLAADDVERADRDIATFRVRHARELRCVPQNYEVISRCYLHLYQAAPATLLAELDRRWPELKRHGITDVPVFLLELVYLRGCALTACLAEETRGEERARLHGRARREEAFLRRSPLALGAALGELLGACLDLASGDPARGLSRLARAVPPLTALGLALHADSAEHLRGRTLGGEEGRRLVGEAESRMRSLGIWEARRMASVFAPG